VVPLDLWALLDLPAQEVPVGLEGPAVQRSAPPDENHLRTAA